MAETTLLASKSSGSPAPLGLLDIAAYYMLLLHSGLIQRAAMVDWADTLVMHLDQLPGWVIALSLSSGLTQAELLRVIDDEIDARHVEQAFRLLCAALLVTKPSVAIDDEPFIDQLYSIFPYLRNFDQQMILGACSPCHEGCTCCWEHIPRAYMRLLQHGLPLVRYRVQGSQAHPVQFYHRWD